MTHIELKPRRRPKTASYDPGSIIRGDREIFVDDVRWGHVVMVAGSRRGHAFAFYDAQGREILAVGLDGKPTKRAAVETVRGVSRRAHDGDERSTEQRIIDRTRELIAANRMRSPAILAEEAKISHARWQQTRAEENAKEELTRAALLSLWARTDLSNAEREGLSNAYKGIFHNPIERVAT